MPLPAGLGNFHEAFAWLRTRLIERIEPPEVGDVRTFVAPAALDDLARRFALTRFELQIVLLCLMIDVDPRLGEAYALAQGNGGRPYPTFALAFAVLDEPHVAVLSSASPLHRYRLVERDRADFGELATRRLRLSQRVFDWLSGDTSGLPDFGPAVTALPAPALAAGVDETLLKRLKAAFTAMPPPLIRLSGPDRALKQAAVHRAADEAGCRALRLSLDLMPETHDEAAELADVLDREARLSPLCLFVTSASDAGATPLQASALRGLGERLAVPLIADGDHLEPGTTRALLPIDLPVASPADRRARWWGIDGFAHEGKAGRLATTFETTLSEIGVIEAGLGAVPPDRRFAEAWEGCLRLTRPLLDPLARRIVSNTRLADVILPERQKGQLAALVDQSRHARLVADEWGFADLSPRGLGLCALFAGESGTGKTFAAEAVAGELQFDLYRIDLAAVVSKFIGETEKNLKRIFDAAERGGVALLFDESDALFGRRTEVRDSHDRYANIEVNYLLQRIEDFRGLSILATNRRSALDQAFVRRLAHVVEFPYPDRRQAAVLWAKAFPANAPVEALDFDRLAAFDLTGGSIRNVALRAAHHAARSGQAIGMEAVLAAAREEWRKMGRPPSSD